MAAANTKSSDLVTQLMLRVFQVNGRLLAQGDALVAPLSLNSARWQMLGAIALAEVPLTVPQIAESMGVTRQGAQKQVNRLVTEGLLLQQDNPNHLRSPLYSLSKAGDSLYQQATALNAVWAARLGKGISREALETTLNTLDELLDLLQAPVPTQGEKR